MILKYNKINVPITVAHYILFNATQITKPILKINITRATVFTFNLKKTSFLKCLTR